MASLSAISLKRPVFAIVMSIILIILGGIGYSFLGVREFPAIDPPVITVRTAYTGANADIVESQITEPLEKSINGVPGIKSISSTSNLGSSVITVEFNVGSDLESAANDVRDKVSQATRNLPQDIDAPPVVSKADANSDPVIFMPIQSTTRSIVEVSDYAENVIQEKLQTIPGVSQVQIYGQKKLSMRLWINPDLMAASKLTISDLKSALEKENIELPGGKIYGNSTEITIKTFGRLFTEEDFNNLIIKENQGKTIRLRDVGYAILGPENEETSARRNNVYGVSLAVIPQPGANLVEIADEFYRRLAIIRKELPPDFILDIGIDKSKFVKASILEVQETLVISFVLVVIIIFLFFRDWLTALRPLIDIPVSLIATFFVMYLCDYSINVLTLLGIVLATGLVVDDGIVVTENIFKKVEEGMDIKRAAREGSEEIFFAVVSTSITLAIVFLPILFLQGFVGKLFQEFAVVVAGAVLISAFVSLSLTPVLNVLLTRKNAKRSKFYERTEPFFQNLESGYKTRLSKFMERQYMAPIIMVVCFLVIFFAGKSLPSELAPLEDRGIVRVPLTAPEGTGYDAMEQIVSKSSQLVMDSFPEEQRMVFGIASPSFGATSATNSGFVSVILKEKGERKKSQMEVAAALGKQFSKFNEVRAIPVQEQTISTGLAAGFGLPVQFVVQNLDFEKLRTFIPKIMEEVGKSPVFQASDVNLKFNKPEINITIDRNKANDLGISMQDVSTTLQLAYSGRRFGYFLRNGKQYQVIGQVEREKRDDPTDFKSLYVKNKSGNLIQLDNIISSYESAQPPALYHFNRFKSATVSASLAPGKTIGDGVDEMRAIAKRVVKDDESFSFALSGASRDYAESGSNTLFAFLLAIVMIYLVLAAQFESFTDPLIILITVPLALAGAVFSLWMFNQTLNIFSQIGMIMLIGLVTKNGILIVEFANHKRFEEGLDKWKASLEAATARLRPILMTNLATALGALPLALALGSASGSRVSLGIVIVGGIMFSMALTLFVVPVMYGLFSRKRKENAYSKNNEIQAETTLQAN